MPRAVARLNRYPNRIARPLAPYLPPFLLITHTGRTSGKRYRTPVFGFRTAEGFVIALTYGQDSDWVRNVLATDGGEAVYRRHRFSLTDPRLVSGDPRQQPLPAIVRWALHRFGVHDFLLVRASAR
jgi:deazaflavin-dependent oxidoreductase (nitroreductase family)